MLIRNSQQIRLRPVHDNEFILYEYSDNNRWFTIGRHALENDRGLPFEDYCYQIEVGAFNLWDWQERQRVCRDFARHIFDKLKATQKDNLMLVDGVQVKLDEFYPSPEISR